MTTTTTTTTTSKRPARRVRLEDSYRSHQLLLAFALALRQAIRLAEELIDEGGSSLCVAAHARGENPNDAEEILDFEFALQSVHGSLWAMDVARSACQAILPLHLQAALQRSASHDPR